ncbi:MAG: zinc ABC transporter substrate-binding protein [Methanomassiliicoccales archaeon]|nr:zinc ABC transporter substrate-binding protein [Methanomassiliicoccales archaeon]
MNRKQLLLVTGTSIIIVLLIVASALWGTSSDEDERTLVVATFYPLAYMAKSIGGERVAVSSLVPYNSELHSWSPTPQDIIQADRADVILYNGGPADSWLLTDILPVISTQDKLVTNTTEGVGFIQGGGHEGHDGNEHGGVDPHTWLSPIEARIQAHNVLLALIEADPEGQNYFQERFDSLNQTLTGLHEQYLMLEEAGVSGIIVSHAAFGYVAKEYGFVQYGVIGLSADQEPSLATIIELVSVMENESIYAVYVDPVYKQDYASMLKAELESRTGHAVQVLDLFLMLGPYEGADYLEQMSMNLVDLKIGLGVT